MVDAASAPAGSSEVAAAAPGAAAGFLQVALATGSVLAVAGCNFGEQPPANFFDTAQATVAPSLLRERPLAQTGAQFATPDAAALFDWAESIHAKFFPEPQADRFEPPYVYRFYPSTGNYVGVAGDDVYVLGPVSGNVLLNVGKLSDFAASVHSDVRAVNAEDAAAARLLLQSQFSASDEEIARVREIGAKAWIDEQTSAPRPVTGIQWLDKRGCYDTSVRKGFFSIAWPSWWMANAQMMSAPDATRVRATLALSEYFVVSAAVISSNWFCYAMAAYWDILADNAFGSFRVLLERITLNYAMGEFLNTVDNAKEDGKGRQPDENYAREVMQLFTIGLHELNLDGTAKVGTDGKPIETYDNEDVTNLARVFTGYVTAPDPGPKLPSDDPRTPLMPTRAPQVLPMVLVPSRHSMLECRFLGAVVPANTEGSAALRIALDTLFNHPNVGPFFSRQMIQRLVVSNPSPAYVARVASVFNDNGRGVRGDLRAVFSAIWLDAEARGQGSTEASRIGKLREPMVRIAQWGRTFASEATRARWDIERLFIDRGIFLNQTVIGAPSVFNFFRPGYVPPSTALAAKGWVAPELQITDESSVAVYLIWMQRVIRNGLGRLVSDEVFTVEGQYVGAASEISPAEYARELPLATVAPALVRRLNLLLSGGQLSADVQQMMIDALNATPVTAASSNSAKLDRIAAAVLMVMASPEYLVQH